MEASRTAPDLRPLGVGEILDAAFKVYKARFKTLCLCVLVVVVPASIFSTLVTASVDSDAFDLEQAFSTPQPGTTPAIEIDGAAIAAQVIAGFITLALFTVATAACFRAISAAYLGEEIGWRESLRFAFPKILPAFGLTLLLIVLLIPAFILLIAPGVWLSVAWSLVFPVLLFEGIGGIGALKRSFNLVRGRWWPTFGVLLIMYLLTAVLQGILGALLIVPIFASSGSEVLFAVATTLANIVGYTLTVPLFAGVVVIVYYDLRVRKEGLDVALLAERIGTAAPAAPATPAARHPSGLGTDAPSGLGADAPSYGGFSAPRPPEERDPG